MGVCSSWNFIAEKVKCCSLNTLLLLSALRPLYWCIPVPISCRLLAGHDMMVWKKMKRFLIRFCFEPQPCEWI